MLRNPKLTGIIAVFLLITILPGPAAAQEQQYYLYINGQNQGPFTAAEAVQQPGFDPATMAVQVGSTDWIPAKDVPELVAAQQTAASLPAEPDSASSGNTAFTVVGIIGVILLVLLGGLLVFYIVRGIIRARSGSHASVSDPDTPYGLTAASWRIAGTLWLAGNSGTVYQLIHISLRHIKRLPCQ